MKKNIFSIFKGDDKTMTLKAVYSDTLDPLDLTSCTEIDILLPLANGAYAHRLLSLGQVVIATPTVIGKFSCPIPSTISSTMNVGELQNLDVSFTISGKIITIRYDQSLSVLEKD